MSGVLYMTYLHDIQSSSLRLQDAATLVEGLERIVLCGSVVDVSLLANVLRRHAPTLRSFDMEEVIFLDNEKEHCMYETIFQAFAGATGLEKLSILMPHHGDSRISGVDLLVSALHHMPGLANVQFCRVFSSVLHLNAVLNALHKVNQLILHYEDTSSVDTLYVVITLVNTSSESVKSIEIAGCPNMFKNTEANLKFCNALLKCDKLEYICVCENDLSDDSANVMRIALSESKAHHVKISTSCDGNKIKKE